MIRLIGIALTLAAGYATAAEPMDCFNDETEPGARYTSTEPEVLRVTDADISNMLMRMAESESRLVADVEPAGAMHAGVGSEISNSN